MGCGSSVPRGSAPPELTKEYANKEGLETRSQETPLSAVSALHEKARHDDHQATVAEGSILPAGSSKYEEYKDHELLATREYKLEVAHEGPLETKRSRGDVNEGIVAASLRAKRKGKEILPTSSVIVGASYIKRRVAKSQRQELIILQALAQNALTASLSEPSRIDIMQAMQERSVSGGDIIIRQGEEGDNFYVIDSGTVRTSEYISCSSQ